MQRLPYNEFLMLQFMYMNMYYAFQKANNKLYGDDQTARVVRADLRLCCSFPRSLIYKASGSSTTPQRPPQFLYMHLLHPGTAKVYTIF